jgi:hypothetical protein
MPSKAKKKGPGVFISHSSINLEDAKQVEAALNAGGFNVWLDDSDIRVGVLLGKELLKAIEASRAVVLIWSEAAKNSAWVTTEILAAFHFNRFILPYTLDGTEFPQLLSRSIHGNLRKERGPTLAKLPQDVKRAPRSRNEFPGAVYWCLACVLTYYLKEQGCRKKKGVKSALGFWHRFVSEIRRRRSFECCVLSIRAFLEVKSRVD